MAQAGDLDPSHQAKATAAILLEKPEVGVYADEMMIVVGEQGEVDVNGKSLGPVRPDHPDIKKNELISEIISHFSL